MFSTASWSRGLNAVAPRRARVGWDLAVTPGVVGIPNTVRGGRYLKYRPPLGTLAPSDQTSAAQIRQGS